MVMILLGGDVAHALDTADTPLQREGWDVRHARDTASLLREAQTSPVRLVMIDAHTPGLDAAKICIELKSDPATSAIPVILVATPGEQVKFADCGADGFVSRPITLPRLLEALRRFVPMDERAGGRLALGLSATYRAGDRDGMGVLRDLGPDGMFLQTGDPFRVGDEIEVAFTLPVPAGRELRLGGTVVRVAAPDPPHHHRAGIGVQFRGVSGSDRLEIAKYLRDRLEPEP